MRDIVAELKALRLHGMAQCYAEQTAHGGASVQIAAELFGGLLDAEVADRHVRSIRYQMRAARFPHHRDLAGFDFSVAAVDEPLVRQLATGEFSDAAANIVLIGGTGTGKSHLATALGIKAITEHGKRVRFYSTVDLVNTLEQEKAAGKHGRLAFNLMHVDIVILDELGYLPFSTGGGALLFFGRMSPLQIKGAAREHPPSVSFLRRAKADQDTWVDAEKPFWLDFPIWLASSKLDSVGICQNHMQRGGMLDNEAWGKARDLDRYPPPHGNGLWTQDIYYHVLNCGMRIPPSAGSASGVLPNPVGYNRCYVRTGGPPTVDRWWEGLRAGRVFVTNGPLLTVQASGQDPGHVFASDGPPVTIALRGEVVSREPISRLEVIRNGRIEHTLPVQTAYDDVMDLWRNTEVGYTPTLCVAYGGISGEQYWYEVDDLWLHPRLQTFTPPHILAPRSRRRSKSPTEDYNHIRVAEIARQVVDQGGLVQAGGHGQLNGICTHWEMWSFVQGGMTPIQALRCGSLFGAKYLGLDADLGSIKAGKLADLIVFEAGADPTQEIRHSERIQYVVANGRIEAVKVTRHQEKQFYSALTDTPRQIIEKQGVQGVDATTGATITAEAIINATAKALSGAAQ